MDDDQAPICIPFPPLSPCRIQSSAGWYWWEQGGGRGAGCCHHCPLATHGCCGEDAAAGLIPAGGWECITLARSPRSHCCSCHLPALLGTGITKLTGILGTFPGLVRACDSGGCFCPIAVPALAPGLGSAGEWGAGAGPWFCSQWVVETTSAVKGLALGVGHCCGTQERACCSQSPAQASRSQDLKPWAFLSAKLLSCTSGTPRGQHPGSPSHCCIQSPGGFTHLPSVHTLPCP